MSQGSGIRATKTSLTSDLTDVFSQLTECIDCVNEAVGSLQRPDVQNELTKEQATDAHNHIIRLQGYVLGLDRVRLPRLDEETRPEAWD